MSDKKSNPTSLDLLTQAMNELAKELADGSDTGNRAFFLSEFSKLMHLKL